ncbi:MAG TPA: protein-glutamate O-methyltransferase CheR [Pyrinomonadaceae bacterium]|jgi:chemotaxis protein methyltransferase CheR
MGFNSDISGVRRGAETLLRDLIHERVGLIFDDSKINLLADKLAPLIVERGFDSFLDYYYLLKYDADAAEEWRNVIDALTVQETYFWREMDQIHGLAEEVVPRLAAENPRAAIRIWSAACATGEEPLTIAMRLNESGWFERAKIEIYASDASRAALERARRGTYRERAFRALPDDLKRKYFAPAGKEWSVAPALREKIRWTQANLLEPGETAPLADVSVIFCRNVFIYFSPAAIRRVVDLFAEKMSVPAFLFVGAAESLLKVTDDFDLEEIGKSFVYVKRK